MAVNGAKGKARKAKEELYRQLILDAKVHASFWQEQVTVYAKGDNLTATTPIVSRRPFGSRPSRPFFAQLGFKYAW